MYQSHNGCKGTALFGNKQIFGALFFPEGLHMSEFIRIFEFRSKILLVASLGKSGIAERAASEISK